MCSFVFIFFMVERFHHLGVAWVVFLGGIIGAVGAILYMSVLLNTLRNCKASQCLRVVVA